MAAASSSYSWEERARSCAEEGDDPPDLRWDDSDEEMPEAEITGEEAGNFLVDFLLGLHYAGKLSARSLCVICFYASRAGAAGKVGSFGFRPEAPSGHFQRHLDAANGINMNQQLSWRYSVGVPLHDKYDRSRNQHALLVNVPHEALNEEILDDPSILQRAAEMSWPPAWWANPIVAAATCIVLPLALYLDGVPSTARDGILGIFMYNLVTHRRHLIAVIRKSSLCKCGCKGWDTIHPVWCFVHWSLQAMAKGRFPEQRHDRADWKPADGERRSLAGSCLAFTAALLQIKGDWLEFCSSLGLVSWADNVCPCPFCKTTKHTMRKFRGFSPLSSVHDPVSQHDYDAACSTCEQKRVLTRPDYIKVKNSLEYSKAKDGPRGRALMVPIPALGLEKHDRLEPDRVLQDVGAPFDQLATEPTNWPIEVTFWRRAMESRSRHRLPLFDAALGISLLILCVDVLHGLWLGPAKDWCTAVFWSLIDYNVFGVDGTLDTRIINSVMRIKTELWDFYKRYREANPGADVTELENLTPGMLGKNNARMLSTKAAETKYLVPFCLEVLARHAARIPVLLVRQYTAIGECMQGLNREMSSQGFVMEPSSIQAMYDFLLRLYVNWEAAELPCKPKLHQLMHMVDRAAFQGNPAFYATWADETLNKVLAALGRQAHRTVWECRVLVYFEESQRRAVKKRRF